MKETFEKIILFIILTSIIIAILSLIAKSNQKVKDNAIATCGSESNLVEHIDNDGTTWYSCKVDK